MQCSGNKKSIISIVAPMFNEEEVLDIFFDAIHSIFASLDVQYEIICVNDGSTDNTLKELRRLAQSDRTIKAISLSRNYGKEIALSAGLDYANGDAVIPVDCDLQDPPEVIPKLIEKWQNGYQVVLAKRIDRSSDSKMKRWTSSFFYNLINKISDVAIPPNVGDFRLLDKVAVAAIRQYKERSRFMKGLFATLGFKETTVEYVRAPRAAGTTKWNYWKLYKLALEGIISFTSFPLKIWSYFGVIISLGAFSYGIYLVIKTLIFGIDSPGYASTMVVLLFMSGLILTCLGVIGEYLARIFIEVKSRPLYFVEEEICFGKSTE